MFPFLFCFRTNRKKTIRWKWLLSLLWDFFSKVSFWNYLIKLCSNFCRNNYKAFWKRHLNGYIQLKISRIWITIWTNFFSSKYLQIKIGEGAWKMITYTIIRACSSKNITPKHFTYYCMLLFLSNKPSL